jgi:hypothetical protein
MQHFRTVAMLVHKQRFYQHALPFETFSNFENKIQIL